MGISNLNTCLECRKRLSLVEFILFCMVTFFVMGTHATNARCSELFENEETVHVLKVSTFIETSTKLHDYLVKHQKKADQIILRFFSATRLEQMITNGTDRDSTSYIFNHPVWDATTSQFEESHTEKENVTYGHLLKWDGRRFLTVQSAISKGGTALDDILEMKGGSPGSMTAIAIYDPTDVIQAAPVEFWFQRSPLESLSLIFLTESNLRQPWTRNLKKFITDDFSFSYNWTPR